MTIAYCPDCEEEQEIRSTVPWQPDICTVCGANIQTDD